MAMARSSAPASILITTLLVAALFGCTPKPDKLSDVATPTASPGWSAFAPKPMSMRAAFCPVTALRCNWPMARKCARSPSKPTSRA
jgi:hypothetical protein